jgi:hypothetical protein
VGVTHVNSVGCNCCLEVDIGVLFPEFLLLSGGVMYSNLRESNVKVTGPCDDKKKLDKLVMSATSNDDNNTSFVRLTLIIAPNTPSIRKT